MPCSFTMKSKTKVNKTNAFSTVGLHKGAPCDMHVTDAGWVEIAKWDEDTVRAIKAATPRGVTVKPPYIGIKFDKLPKDVQEQIQDSYRKVDNYEF